MNNEEYKKTFIKALFLLNDKMQFEQNKSIEKLGVKVGFLFSYFLFTTILFGIFTLLNKLNGMTYLHIMGITLLIIFIGAIIKRFLK